MRGFTVLAALLATFAGSAHASPAQNYMLYCMGCHGAHAEGVPGKVPALAGRVGDYMRIPVGRDFILRVPGASKSALSDAQLGEVLNWLAVEYAADSKIDVVPFTAAEVSAHRHQPLLGVLAARREVIRALLAAGIPAADTY